MNIIWPKIEHHFKTKKIPFYHKRISPPHKTTAENTHSLKIILHVKISHEANKIYFQYFPFPSSSLRCTLFWKGFLHTHTLHLWSVYPFIDVGSFPSFFAAAFTYLFSSRLGKFIPPPTCFRLVEDFFRPFSPLFPLPDSSPKAPGEINLTAQHTIAGKICHILCWKVGSIKLEKTCGKHHKKKLHHQGWRPGGAKKKNQHSWSQKTNFWTCSPPHTHMLE